MVAKSVPGMGGINGSSVSLSYSTLFPTGILSYRVVVIGSSTCFSSSTIVLRLLTASKSSTGSFTPCTYLGSIVCRVEFSLNAENAPSIYMTWSVPSLFFLRPHDTVLSFMKPCVTPCFLLELRLGSFCMMASGSLISCNVLFPIDT